MISLEVVCGTNTSLHAEDNRIVHLIPLMQCTSQLCILRVHFQSQCMGSLHVHGQAHWYIYPGTVTSNPKIQLQG